MTEPQHYCRVVLQPNRQQGLGGTRYASCSCGWAGSSRRTSERAWTDAKEHMAGATHG